MGKLIFRGGGDSIVNACVLFEGGGQNGGSAFFSPPLSESKALLMSVVTTPTNFPSLTASFQSSVKFG
jgi:hypothetical protein